MPRPKKPSVLDETHLPEATAAKQRIVLQTYGLVGTVTAACEAAGIVRKTHYLWMEKDAAYRELFADAKATAVDRLEAEARRRAVAGVEEPIYHQGRQVGVVRKYSDMLLMFLLNGAAPEKYKHRHEHAGPDGGPIPVDARVVVYRLPANGREVEPENIKTVSAPTLLSKNGQPRNGKRNGKGGP